MKKTLLILIVIIFLCNITNAQSTFSPQQIIDNNLAEDPTEIATGDLDGDGIIDIVIASHDITTDDPDIPQDYIKWYKNDGSGNFSLQAVVSSTIMTVNGLEVADIDGQYGKDIIATSLSQGKLVYYPSNGSGGFGNEVLISNLSFPGELKTGDINKDGETDIVVTSYGDNKTIVTP